MKCFVTKLVMCILWYIHNGIIDSAVFPYFDQCLLSVFVLPRYQGFEFAYVTRKQQFVIWYKILVLWLGSCCHVCTSTIFFNSRTIPPKAIVMLEWHANNNYLFTYVIVMCVLSLHHQFLSILLYIDVVDIVGGYQPLHTTLCKSSVSLYIGVCGSLSTVLITLYYDSDWYNCAWV